MKSTKAAGWTSFICSSDQLLYYVNLFYNPFLWTVNFTPPVFQKLCDNKVLPMVTWNASEGAEKYRVLRKTGSGDWTALGETAGTGFTDTTANSSAKTKYTEAKLPQLNYKSKEYNTRFHKERLRLFKEIMYGKEAEYSGRLEPVNPEYRATQSEWQRQSESS